MFGHLSIFIIQKTTIARFSNSAFLMYMQPQVRAISVRGNKTYLCLQYSYWSSFFFQFFVECRMSSLHRGCSISAKHSSKGQVVSFFLCEDSKPTSWKYGTGGEEHPNHSCWPQRWPLAEQNSPEETDRMKMMMGCTAAVSVYWEQG